MIVELKIRDFAIIDRLAIEFGPGLSVLTGQTGAGKSILVGALGLVLGDRASADVVRQGAKRAEVTAVCDLSGHETLLAWLSERDLDADGECIIRRVVAQEGRSRAYVNGNPVPVQLLRELGDRLMDIHGQHEHQSLVRRDVQRQIVDTLGQCDDLLARTAERFELWRDLDDRHESLTAARDDREARLDLLKFQLDELEALGLADGELETLEQEHRRIANVERLAGAARNALDVLYDNDEVSVQSLLAAAERGLEPLRDVDASLATPAELIAGAGIQVSEAADALRHYLDELDIDPARAAHLSDRIGSAHQLARKHRIAATELPARLVALRDEYDTLDRADAELESLARKLAAARVEYNDAAAALSARRKTAATGLSARIGAVMAELGMPGGVFEAAVSQASPPVMTATGIDRIEFRVSANPGQDPKPLAKVASGGELSRIGLAIQVVAANASPIPAMVFDEVDAGVGGGVAEIVGQKLRALGESSQVLVVTHLPQVASQAHRHYRVEKLTDGKTTRTTIATLNDDERVEELARMLGGVRITRRTRDHAREMIDRAQGE